MKALGTEGERLIEIHPNQAEDIRSKQAEIEQNWEKLRKKVNELLFIDILICCYDACLVGVETL